MAEDEDASAVRADEAVGQLQQNALAAARRAEQQASFAVLYLEGDVLEYVIAIEGDGDIVEDDRRCVGLGLIAAGGGFL